MEKSRLIDNGWMEEANCRGEPVGLFFSYEASDNSLAKLVCSECVVQPDCLKYAVDNKIIYGIWGGTDEYERRVLIGRRRRRSTSGAPRLTD